MVARMTPRLVGFLSAIDREFFEIFCSVDGVGVRKALRAMVRPVRELARTIQDQDVKLLATYPGHRRGDRRADRRQAAPEGRQVRPDRRRRASGRSTAHAAEINGSAGERRARRDPRHLRRAPLGRPHREPGAPGDRPGPDREEKVQDRRRHDRCDLPAESMRPGRRRPIDGDRRRSRVTRGRRGTTMREPIIKGTPDGDAEETARPPARDSGRGRSRSTRSTRNSARSGSDEIVGQRQRRRAAGHRPGRREEAGRAAAPYPLRRSARAWARRRSPRSCTTSWASS